MKVTFLKDFNYDEETFIKAGTYELEETGINGYPMVLVNDEWLDFCDLESLECVIE